MGKVLVLAGALAASVALVGTALATHAWGNYHWARVSNPLTLNLGDNVSTAWDSYLATTSSNWSTSTVLKTSVVPGAGNRRCGAVSGRVEVCNDRYGFNGWLGVAQIWASGNHITQGTVKVNDSYFDTATYGTKAWRQMVMCQEVGHTFGLDHQDENFDNPNLGTCMDYTNDPARNDGNGNNEQPNAHDYEELGLIYQHSDGSSGGGGGGGSGCPGNSKKCQGGLEKAPPFSQASRANGHLYVDDLGNGERRITHVFWTPFGE